MSKTLLDAAVWLATFLGLIVGGLVAAMFVVMPTSLGPSEMIEAGVEPWTTALYAAGAFVALVVAAVIGLVLWHSARFRLLGLLLVVAQVVAVAWTSLAVYADYF